MANSTPENTTFVPPSVLREPLLSGDSYSYYTPVPPAITTLCSTPTLTERGSQSSTSSSNSANSTSSTSTEATPCVLGIDEAGRGPVLGPMVYSAFYLPNHLHHRLLTQDHSFNDSKALTPAVRSNMMRVLCSPGNQLFDSCGWAVKVLSARDISSGMMRPGYGGVYNLNAQAADATLEIIQGVVENQNVDVRDVFIDTVGNPKAYQQKLEGVFPALNIHVAKKADSLYPCVSAASIVAKVTRDAALEACYEMTLEDQQDFDEQSANGPSQTTEGWGSGYPSDSKCVGWLRRNMDPIFGWGHECRFSWGTAKEMLESETGTSVDWNDDNGDDVIAEFMSYSKPEENVGDELRNWYGHKSAVL